MSTRWLTRRRFLTVALGIWALPGGSPRAEVRGRRGAYAVAVGMLHDMLTFRLAGTVEERVDREAGQYEVIMVGQGPKISNRLEARGRLLEGRWVPVQSQGTFQMVGRESRSEI